jgi:hypothetical protein
VEGIENSVVNRASYRKMALGACGDMFGVNYLFSKAKTRGNSTPTVKSLKEKGFRVQNKCRFQFLISCDPWSFYIKC